MITIDADMNDFLRKNSERIKRAGDMASVMGEIGLYMKRSVQRNFREQGRPKWPKSIGAEMYGGKTMSRTGGLVQSIAFNPSNRDVTIGTNKLYGRIQQLGGVIRPKKAKALAIPLSKAAAKMSQEHSSLREVPGLFFIPSKDGKNVGILARKKGAKGKGAVEAMFALRTSVKIPPRPFLVIQPEDQKWIERKILAHIKGN